MNWYTVKHGDNLSPRSRKKLRVKRTDLAEANYLSTRVDASARTAADHPRGADRPPVCARGPTVRPRPEPASRAPRRARGRRCSRRRRAREGGLSRQGRRHALLDRPDVSHDGGLAQDLEPPRELAHQHRRPPDDLHGPQRSPRIVTPALAGRLAPASQLLHYAPLGWRRSFCTRLAGTGRNAPLIPGPRAAARRRAAACMRARRAGDAPLGDGLRDRRLPGPGRGGRGLRPAGLHDGGAARPERPGEPRPRPERHPQLGLRVPAAPDHRQPGAGRRPQRRVVVRPADRARHPRRNRRRSSAADRRRGRAPRRAVARRVIQPARGVLPIAVAARRHGFTQPAAPRRQRPRGCRRRLAADLPGRVAR